MLGDFNIAPEDRDVHDPAAWVGSVLVSPEEREALRAALEPRTRRRVPQVRAAAALLSVGGTTAPVRSSRNNGLRIDLLLASPALAERCTACTIDREPRRVAQASDHTPVIATFDI